MKTPSSSVTNFCLRNPSNAVFVTDRQTGALWGGMEAMKAECDRLGITVKRVTEGWKLCYVTTTKPTEEEI